MATRPISRRLAQLWQLPLLVVSLGLFGYAAYLFIDPKPGLTIDEKLTFARKFIDDERPEPAIQFLNQLLTTHKLQQDKQGLIHMMLAEALEDGQKLNKTSLDINHRQIIEQTRLAVSMGIKADAQTYRRLGESYEAIDKPAEALDNYRRAMAMDQSRTFRLQRKIIELQITRNEAAEAEKSIDEYLKLPDLTPAERGWALGNQAKLLADRGAFVEARESLAEAIKLDSDPIAMGQVNYRLGYCAWKLGDWAEAERLLRLARDQFKSQHPLDADAAQLLGRIFQDRSDWKTAQSFYQDVIVSHPDSESYVGAMLGRGVCRILQNQDAGGLSDLKFVVNQVLAKESKQRFRADTIEGLHQATAALQAQDKLSEALEVMAYEQQLVPDPPGSFFARLGAVYEKRADQVERSMNSASAADKIRDEQQVRDCRTKAGDSFVAYSRALTLADDHGYGDALWHGIEMYDKASNLQSVITAMELFVAERPEDPLAPDALLRLGRSYQAAGLFDKAINAFQRNQFRYPQSLAASRSAVPLAEAFIAKGPESFGKAESVLLSIVENNPIFTPAAEEFKSALFQLAQLYYRTGRYEEAVAKLEELTERYPTDDRIGQLVFLMADSYRKSAALIDVKLLATSPQATGAPVVDIAQATTAKKDRLEKARELFDRTISTYASKAPTTDTDKLYQKLAHFYRADCMYDLGDYTEAIKQYDATTFRHQNDPSTLAAYVQIVNAYCALGKTEEAKTANERAKWLLRRMPQDAFQNGAFAMPKAYWEQWLKWTSTAGMW
ncbi:hypothetical protein BH10PLA1_BH10PLA1_16990 [soil metagenome]